jgi:hypothetical protein
VNDTCSSGAAERSALSLRISLSRPAVLPHVEEDEPLHLLLRLTPSPHQVITPSGHHLGLLLDASGSMHRIVLDGPERGHWRQLGAERGDLKWGRVDGREGWLWSGQTLAELQARHRTPMQAALRALTRAGERLRPEDRLTVIAFADRAQRLVAANAPDRAAAVRAAGTALARGVDEAALGSGTRLAEALRMALVEVTGDGRGPSEAGSTPGGSSAPGSDRNAEGRPTPARLLLISDGLLEDRAAASAWVERVAEAGVLLSCIGVGDQFDEELLMWAADTTRGRFCYAPAADALEAAVAEELDRLETLTLRRATLTLSPLGGAMFRDICQVTPDLSALHRLETDGLHYQFGLGDLSTGSEAVFLAELSLPSFPPGPHPVARVEIAAETPEGERLVMPPTEAEIVATADLFATSDAQVLEAVAAVHAHRAERRAQRALRRGQIGEATRHLRDTRQIVERLGRAELAAELEAHAAAIESGAHPSAERVKRIKAETRRLLSG